MRLKFSLLTTAIFLIGQNLYAQFTFVEEQRNLVGPNTKLDAVKSIIVSPDDKHVYAGCGNFTADGVTVYSINSGDGSLTWVQEVTTGGDALDDVWSLRLDCNGDHLYVMEEDDDQVSWYSRNAATGVLTYGGTVGTIATTGARCLEVHPSGDFVYVGSFNRIEVYSRNTVTGALTYSSSVVTGITGAPPCAAPHLNYVEGIALSQDSAHLYAASTGSNANCISVFDINAGTGALTHKQDILYGATNCPGGAGYRPEYIVISEDGSYVYTSGAQDDGFTTYDRNTTTGILTEKENFPAPGAQLCRRVQVTPHGDQVIFTENSGSAAANQMHVYDVGGTGLLTFAESFQEGVAGVTGIDDIYQMAFTSDSKYLYVAGEDSDAIAVFDNTSKSVDAPSGCALPVVLGVELVRFEAKREENDKVNLVWRTDNETDCDYFAIERSVDGVNFKEIGVVSGSGTTSMTRYYSFEDIEPLYSGAYYRLRQVDYDLSTFFSDVRFVSYGEKCEYLISQNESEGIISIQPGSCHLGGQLLFEVYDASGPPLISPSHGLV